MKSKASPSKRTQSSSDEPIADLVRSLLKEVGENPKREGLLNTPQRFAKAFRFLTSGSKANLKEIVGDALFSTERSEELGEIVLVRDIEVFSLCEHHMLPFFGKAHVAYIPVKKFIGLSKIPRIVDAFARRLQVQERLTVQIAHALKDIIEPEGVAVIIEAHHLCMMMRGVEKQRSRTITSSMLGVFRENATTRKELLSLLNGLGRGFDQ